MKESAAAGVEKDVSDCTPFLKALADENRWRLVQVLLEGQRTVTELVEELGATQYNVSKHLRVLREVGIVEAHREGRFVYSRITGSFRTRVSGERRTLNLGCCSFHFDRRGRSQKPRRRAARSRPTATA